MTETIGESGFTATERGKQHPFSWAVRTPYESYSGSVVWCDILRRYLYRPSYRPNIYYDPLELRDLAAFLEKVNEEQGSE